MQAESLKKMVLDIRKMKAETQTVELKAGQGFGQGIFLQYGIVEDDNTTDERNGGFGSTTK